MTFPVKPPREWFSKPNDLQPGDGIVVNSEGRVYGYVTLWNARLINGGRGNTQPPRSRSGYTYANAFTTECADGSKIRTGVIAAEGGHRYKNSFGATQKAYADISTRAARVVYGEDRHGVWFSGAVQSDATDQDIADIRGGGISGHWERPSPGKPLELLGSCLVNIPGFAQASNHRIAASAEFTPGGGLTLTPTLRVEDAERNERNKQSSNGRTSMAFAGNRITAAAGTLTPISGTLATLGSPSVDGRTVLDVTWNQLPLPLWYTPKKPEWGHVGGVMVGRIDDIVIEGSIVQFKGVMDSELDHSHEADVVAQLGVLGISMDSVCEGEIHTEYDEDGWPVSETFERLLITGATLTSEPAFQETIGVSTGEGAGVDEATTPDMPVIEVVPDEEVIAAAASAAMDLPIADLDAEWDYAGAIERVLEHTQVDGMTEWSEYGDAFFYVDDADTESVDGYKLAFADVVDGVLTAIPGGIYAAAASVDDAGIPDDQMDAVKASIASYYEMLATKFDDPAIVPPWEPSVEIEVDVDVPEVTADSGLAASASPGYTTIKLPTWLTKKEKG